jgi:hypothetical protein
MEATLSMVKSVLLGVSSMKLLKRKEEKRQTKVLVVAFLKILPFRANLRAIIKCLSAVPSILRLSPFSSSPKRAS